MIPRIAHLDPLMRVIEEKPPEVDRREPPPPIRRHLSGTERVEGDPEQRAPEAPARGPRMQR